MKIILTPESEKQLRKIPKSERLKIQRKLLQINENSLAGKKLEGEFVNHRSLRAWPYRIIYITNTKTQTIWIISIIHRQSAYK